MSEIWIQNGLVWQRYGRQVTCYHGEAALAMAIVWRYAQ